MAKRGCGTVICWNSSIHACKVDATIYRVSWASTQINKKRFLMCRACFSSYCSLVVWRSCSIVALVLKKSYQRLITIPCSLLKLNFTRERSYRFKQWLKSQSKSNKLRKPKNCVLVYMQTVICTSMHCSFRGHQKQWFFLETLYNRFFLLVKQLFTGNCAIYNGYFVCKYSSAAVKDECKNGIIFLSMRYFLVTPVMFLRRLVT